MAAARKFRIDPRLALGVVLVLISVAGVVGIVRAVAQTTTVYVAASTLAAGDRVTTEQLRTIEVSAATPTDLYLTPSGQVDFVATRPIGAGELVPKTALGEADASMSAAVVSVSGALPAGVTTGAEVAVWAAKPGERLGSYDTPTVVVDRAQVVRVIETDDFVAQQEVEVELRIPDSEFASLMNVTSNGARLQLVPLHDPVA